VLDPFTGSASTAIASLMDGYRFIGCEQSAEYLPIATARVTGAHDRPELARALLGVDSTPPALADSD
jgi:site-specific DNA-methyltransferase (adenine-specific)